MGLFGLGGKKPPSPPSPPDTTIPDELFELYCAQVRSPDNRIRVEDLLTLAAAVAAEACLGALGEVDVEAHTLNPGQAVFSDRMNGLLSGDVGTWPEVTPDSVFGIIRQGALAAGYAPAEFPELSDVFRLLAGRIGQVPWGFVPLSVPEANGPHVMPLRLAFEAREAVKAVWRKHGTVLADRPFFCALALVRTLGPVREAIDHHVALTLVLETLNGMSKTAPFHQVHYAQMQADAAAAASGAPEAG